MMTGTDRHLPGFASGAATARLGLRPQASAPLRSTVLQVRRAPTQLSLFESPADQHARRHAPKKA